MQVERVPKPIRTNPNPIYHKIGSSLSLDEANKQTLHLRKANFHTYYSLETDFPPLQGAHTTACSVPTRVLVYAPYGTLVHLYVNGCLQIVDQHFTHFALISRETTLRYIDC